MTAPSFLHTDPGTPEPEWLGDPRWADRPVVDVDAVASRFDELLVTAAHPDDESLAVGGLIARAGRAGVAVRVLVATEGEASHPHARGWTPDLLAEVRPTEVDAAVARLAPSAVVEHLGLPDGGLAQREGELLDALAARSGPRTLVVAPSVVDGHPDHDALGRAAAEAVAATGASVAHYPLWSWHWGGPADLDWSRVHVVELGPDDLDAKAAALGEHRSQVLPLGPGNGEAAVVGAALLRRAARPFEVLLAEPDVLPHAPPRADSVVSGPFDAMYDDGVDPWGFEGSFYEERKRALTAAVLSRPHYRTVVEVGCATGVLTRVLAERADEVIAIDVSGAALDVARTGAPEHVTWVHGRAPDALHAGAGTADLVVLSEVGYFLTPLELLETLRRVRQLVGDGGEAVLVHWRHPTEGVPLDGPVVHDVAAAVLADLTHRVHHEDADVLIDVWGGPESVATREGRR